MYYYKFVSTLQHSTFPSHSQQKELILNHFQILKDNIQRVAISKTVQIEEKELQKRYRLQALRI